MKFYAVKLKVLSVIAKNELPWISSIPYSFGHSQQNSSHFSPILLFNRSRLKLAPFKNSKLKNSNEIRCETSSEDPTTRMNEQTIEWFESVLAVEALRLYGFRCSPNPGIHDFKKKKTRQKQGCAIPNGIYCTTTKPATNLFLPSI